MSLSTTGFWKVGFWSTTFWKDGFWYEVGGSPTTIQAGYWMIEKRRRRM